MRRRALLIGGRMAIEYGKPEWQVDPAAALAEARRRVAIAATSDDPEEYEALWFYDLGALQELPGEISALHRLRGLYLSAEPSGKPIFVPRRAISDISCLSGLGGLTWLNLSATAVTDIGALSDLSGLTSLDLSSTEVTNIGVLPGLGGLIALDLSNTEVTDIGVLSGLSELTRLYLIGTRVADLSVLRQLPLFEAEKATSLQYKDTPAAANDRRLDLLSRLPPDRCAVETVQYLKGTHPDFREPGGGVAPASTAARLAEASPVALEVQDGRLEAVNPGPPERLAPVELAARLAAIRVHLADLIDEARTRQVPDAIRARFERYASPLAMVEPTYLMLDGPMSFLRGAVGEAYVTEALDGGFVEGWRALIVMHDDLRPLLVPPIEDDPALPDLTDEATPEDGEALVDEAIAVMGASDAVGVSVLAALGAMTEYFQAAKADMVQRQSLLRRGFQGLGGIISTIASPMNLAASAITIQIFAATPTGQALIAQLQPILHRILQYFGAG